MPPLPPIGMIREILLQGVIPPIVAAGSVLFVTSRLGKRLVPIGAMLAVVVGFVVGNHFRSATEYRIDSERPLALGEWGAEVYHAVLGTPEASEDAPRHPPAHYWLVWSALIAGVVGAIAGIPGVPVAIGWLARVIVCAFVARLLVPASLRAELPWLWPTFAAVVLAEWALLDKLGEEPRGWLPLGIGLVFSAGAAVLIHAHEARLTDLATILAGCWFGVAIAVWMGANARSAAPIAAVALPGLMLVGQQSTFSEVPLTSFVAMALAPLALVPLLLPALRRRKKTLALVGLGLLLIVVGTAIVLAARAESLDFE